MIDQTTVQQRAQAALPVSPNNGNPFTIYNQTPNRGGYLPPVSNAYDEWRINPIPPVFNNPFYGIGAGPNNGLVPVFGGNNGGGTIPVLPPSSIPGTPPSSETPPAQGGNSGLVFPVGSGGWMLGGPTELRGLGSGIRGTLNTGYTTPYFGMGISGMGSNGMVPGSGLSGTSLPSWLGMRGLGGGLLDAFLPGDAIQNGRLNAGNLGFGVVDQVTGLPVTWLADMIANSNWAQTSDNALARWLRQWDFQNDDAALQEWYRDNNIVGKPEGWLQGAFANMGISGMTSGAQSAGEGMLEALRRALNNTSGRRARGGASVLEGEEAREAFESMYWAQLMAPTFQFHDQVF